MLIAVEFAKHVKVIGFNHNEKSIQQYKSSINPTHEVADGEKAKRIYRVELEDMGRIRDMDVVIFAFAHDEFKKLEKSNVDTMFESGKKVLLGVKGILNPQDYAGYSFGRLLQSPEEEMIRDYGVRKDGLSKCIFS